MSRRKTNIVLASLTGATLAGAGVISIATVASDNKKPVAESQQFAGARQDPAKERLHNAPKKPTTKKKKKRLPSGVSTATSFWDPETASGHPMSYETIASPYWPLGTKVKITYHGKSKVGVVEDFGPAEWAVAQHDPPALVDLSEKMMADFTGARSNSVTVKFQVLKMGSGRSYRSSGTGYDTAMKAK